MEPAQPGRMPPIIHPMRLAPARGLAEGVRAWSGMLVDGGCRNRERFALQTPAGETLPPRSQQRGNAARSPQVPEEVTENLVPDVAARQMDMGCAITGATTAFAIVLDNGQLKDLDEGGNTFAWEAVQATPEGQALMAGKQRGVKPRAVLQGTLRNDKIIVESVRLEQGQARNGPVPAQTTPLRQP